MDYLYALQNFRQTAPDFVTYIFLFISEFLLYTGPVFAAVIYWSINKKEGASVLLGYAGASFVNQTVKNIACVYRPWIRDSRLSVEKYAAKSATGYSFPSGHTTTATSIFGQIAIYQKAKKWLCALCVFIILAVAFSRNFLGAHTLQDVLVAIIETVIVLVIINYIKSIIEKNTSKDTLVALLSLLISTAIILFLQFKKYPLDYDSDGKILVDPYKMLTDCYVSYGMFTGAVCGWWLERHFVKFSTDGSLKEKIIRSLVGVIIFVAMYLGLSPLLKFMGSHMSHLVKYFLITFVSMYVYPLIFTKIKIHKTVLKNKKSVN